MGRIYLHKKDVTEVVCCLGLEDAIDALRDLELQAVMKDVHDAWDFTIVVHGKVDDHHGTREV